MMPWKQQVVCRKYTYQRI